MNNDDKQQVAAITTMSGSYEGPERRLDSDQWRDHVNKRLDDGAATMRALKADIADNTKATKKAQQSIEKVQGDTGEIVDLMRSFDGAMKVLNMLGRLAKPLGYILAAIGAAIGLLSAYKGTGLPK